ncbi:MAG TPA: PQQ-binding-like beta-propeller repeat protein [Planctomycetota bacterium]|nr:PQQ-binding-like beta-propeller repeat protein [Planctomycetota bacterium]
MKNTVGLLCLALEASVFSWGADWPQLGCTPQRTNRSPEPLSPPPDSPWDLKWQKNFWPERLHNAVQAVVVEGRVYVGTKDGTVWCLAAEGGEKEASKRSVSDAGKNRQVSVREPKELWATKGLGCINNTVAVASGVVIVPSLEGVHGLDAETGQRKWTVECPGGFTAAPLVAEGKVFIGSRLGTMFCLNPADGAVVWKRETGSYILQSAAYDDGRVFFATEDLHMRCLDAASGTEVWKSGPFRSQSFVHFHPVVHQGYVIFRGMVTQPTLGLGDFGVHPFGSPYGEEGAKALAMIPKLMELLAKGQPLPSELDAPQEKIVEAIRKSPWLQDLWVLDAKTGKEAFLVPHWPGVGSLGLGGPLSPPAVDREGRLIIHTVFAGHTFGCLDLKQRKVVDILFAPLVNGKPVPQGNTDEYRAVSTAGALVFMVHAGMLEGAVALRQGVFDLRTRNWWRGDVFPPGATGSWFEHQGAAASAADGRFYHVTYNHLMCYAPH